MKEFFLSDCPRFENKVVTSTFVVITKQVKPKKTGEPYLALTLGDRCGHIEAKMWDNVEEALDAFDQEDFLKVKGLLNKYKNRFQLTIHKLRRLNDSEVDFADYLPKTTKNIDELWLTLGEYVSTFQEPLDPAARRNGPARPSRRGPTLTSRPDTAALRLRRACIMLILAVCWTMWFLCSGHAIWFPATIRKLTATCCSPEFSYTTSARFTN